MKHNPEYKAFPFKILYPELCLIPEIEKAIINVYNERAENILLGIKRVENLGKDERKIGKLIQDTFVKESKEIEQFSEQCHLGEIYGFEGAYYVHSELLAAKNVGVFRDIEDAREFIRNEFKDSYDIDYVTFSKGEREYICTECEESNHDACSGSDYDDYICTCSHHF
jgi:hypothetical protein